MHHHHPIMSNAPSSSSPPPFYGRAAVGRVLVVYASFCFVLEMFSCLYSLDQAFASLLCLCAFFLSPSVALLSCPCCPDVFLLISSALLV
eukprot:m.52531 g.52531  ORF g.52531 m.52531 type:complete len:90 (-) comp12706_c0_seq4:276-545(-)